MATRHFARRVVLLVSLREFDEITASPGKMPGKFVGDDGLIPVGDLTLSPVTDFAVRAV